MFWGDIYDDYIIDPFRVEDGLNMTSQVYIDLLKDKFMLFFNAIPSVKRNSLIFMQDNAPSHASMMTKDLLSSIGFSDRD